MLPKEVVRKIRRLEIGSAALAQGPLVGQYRSMFKGQGMAFSEVREYFAGDDVRAIDWNVSARFGKPHIKLFEEERDTTMMLMVDISASMYFGTQELSKRELVAEVAAVFAFAAMSQGDSVGLILFSDQVELFVPPKRSRNHVLRILAELYTFECQSKNTQIAVATELLMATCSRRALGILMSDFLCEDWQTPLRRAARKHDTISVVVSDLFEENLPNVGIAHFLDAESGQVTEFDTGGPEARVYRQAVARRANERRSSMRKIRTDFVELQTDGRHLATILGHFRRRVQRRR